MNKRNYGKVVHEGMGGFLNPSTHPEHEWSVRSTYGDTFSMSLSKAAESSWLEGAEGRNPKIRAKTLLKNWKAPDINSPEIQDWIHQVLGYFKNCYSGQDKDGNISWNAGDLRIMKDADPVLNQDIHAGVHLIRKYYPDFKATKEDFDNGYWGSKPQTA